MKKHWKLVHSFTILVFLGVSSLQTITLKDDDGTISTFGIIELIDGQ